MAFTSFGFYIFLVGLLLAYYVLPLKIRWITLLVGSVSFYWYISGKNIAPLLFFLTVIIINWYLAILISNNKGKKICLLLAIAVTIVPLICMKQLPLVVNAMGKKVFSAWIVPIGISFFSMQLIAYVVDVYWGQIEPERNILRFILFVSFFPQIIQGPIPRYKQISEQLFNGNKFDENNFVKGFMLIIWAFFLKLCIADKAGVVVDTLFDNYQAYQGVYVIVAGILYSIQLYTDFLACTCFAQGIAGLFGITIIDNFNHPYFSSSVKEFWRRWHISLSSWLRDYIYIPLGGSRKGVVRKYINLIITFVISGIWHGAGIQYIVWGLMHAVYQIFGDLFTPVKNKLDIMFGIEKYPRYVNGIKIMGTYILVTLAWIIFRATNLSDAMYMIKSIGTVHNPWILTDNSLFNLGLELKEFVVLIISIGILFTVERRQERGTLLRDNILGYPLIIRWFLYILAIISIMIFGTYGYGYDAQSFIYGGF